MRGAAHRVFNNQRPAGLAVPQAFHTYGVYEYDEQNNTTSFRERVGWGRRRRDRQPDGERGEPRLSTSELFGQAKTIQISAGSDRRPDLQLTLVQPCRRQRRQTQLAARSITGTGSRAWRFGDADSKENFLGQSSEAHKRREAGDHRKVYGWRPGRRRRLRPDRQSGAQAEYSYSLRLIAEAFNTSGV